MNSPANIGMEPRFQGLEAVEIDSRSVYAFDFDGVISSRYEDDVYKLAPIPGDQEFLSRAAEVFGIRCHDMDMQYQRHLIYQAAAWKLGLPTDPGPALSLALMAASRSVFCLITARSGWYGVERQREFLRLHDLVPVETFHVGRVPKDRQIEQLCREHQDKRVVYVEDSLSHLRNAQRLGLENLSCIWCNSKGVADDELRDRCMDVISRGIAKWRRTAA